MNEAHVVFLKESDYLQPLYENMRLTDHSSELQIYLEYILPVFDLLSEGGRIEHMIHLKEKIMSKSDKEG